MIQVESKLLHTHWAKSQMIYVSVDMLTRSSEWILNPMPYAGNYILLCKKILLDCDTVASFFAGETQLLPAHKKKEVFRFFHDRPSPSFFSLDLGQ